MNSKAKALILTDDLRPWFEEHGLEMRDIANSSINLRPDGKGCCVWLDVKFYKRNHEGKLYCEDYAKNEPATGQLSVAIKQWPPLTLVNEIETGS